MNKQSNPVLCSWMGGMQHKKRWDEMKFYLNHQLERFILWPGSEIAASADCRTKHVLLFCLLTISMLRRRTFFKCEYFFPVDVEDFVGLWKTKHTFTAFIGIKRINVDQKAWPPLLACCWSGAFRCAFLTQCHNLLRTGRPRTSTLRLELHLILYSPRLDVINSVGE